MFCHVSLGNPYSIVIVCEILFFMERFLVQDNSVLRIVILWGMAEVTSASVESCQTGTHSVSFFGALPCNSTFLSCKMPEGRLRLLVLSINFGLGGVSLMDTSSHFFVTYCLGL